MPPILPENKLEDESDAMVQQKKLCEIRAQLAALADPAYRQFQSALLKKPGEDTLTGSAAHYLGVRLPGLRKLAAKLAKENWEMNLEVLRAANRSQIISACAYEERMLEGILIGLAFGRGIGVDRQLALTADFVPLIDNWGLCDSFCAGLKSAGQYQSRFWAFLQPYLISDKEYEIRFGVVMLLDYFITPEYIDRLYPIFDAIRHDGYYVKMAAAWAVSICYVRFPQKTMRYLQNSRLDDFTYNKALQKIIESLCVSKEDKAVIRSMKRSHKDTRK